MKDLAAGHDSYPSNSLITQFSHWNQSTGYCMHKEVHKQNKTKQNKTNKQQIPLLLSPPLPNNNQIQYNTIH